MTKLERAVVTKMKAVSQASKALDEARRALQGHCTHPEEHCSECSKDADDGYGCWWKWELVVCRLCLAQKRFGVWRAYTPLQSK